MTDKRFDRSIRFFGLDGQTAIEKSSVVFAGLGGLGGMVLQQAALLHVGHMSLFEPGLLKKTNRNRYPTARHGDPIPGTSKVDIARRLVESIAPSIKVETYPESIISENGVSAIKEADVVVGSLDNEGSRLLLLQLCAALQKPYLDLATEILSGEDTLRYGGRVCFSFLGEGCLACLDVLDHEEARRDLATEAERAQHRELYGINAELLGDSGPSVAPLNGVVASAGTMELMAFLTGLRSPQIYLK